MHGILALFIRSLREQVRTPSFTWMRAGMATIILITLMVRSYFGATGAVGMEFFSPFAFYNALMIVVAATSYFASAITEEKEEQTLSLLRMTNLSALAILFGKSTSRIFSGLMLLLVQLPFALLAVTLGGVTWEQIIITYVLLCSFLFFAANLGLFASVLAKNNAYAGVLTAALGWLYFWILDEIAEDYSGLSAFIQAISINWSAASWRDASLNLCISGLVFFFLGWASFNCFATDSPASEPRKKKNDFSGAVSTRAGRASVDAIAWKDYHFIHGGTRVMFAKTLIYAIAAIWICLGMFDSHWGSMESVVWSIFSLSLFAALIETSIAASRIFRIEVRGQTLGDLYILPQNLPALIRSKRRAFIQSLGPIGLILGIALVFGTPSLLEVITHSAETFLVFIQFAILIPLEFIFHYRLTAWFSLRLKWGGLPVSLLISYFGHMVTLGILVLAVQFASGIPLIMILAGFNFALGSAIERMLTERAAAN
jgi:hypothetical protein